MRMNTMDFAKGIGAGLIAGACVGMALKPKKSGKKVITKAVKTAENIIGDIASLM